MLKYLFVFFSVFVFSLVVMAQTQPKNLHSQGNHFLLVGDYTKALDAFLKDYQTDSSDANLNYKIGLCYLNLVTQKKKALSFLEKAILNFSSNENKIDLSEKKVPIDVYYYYGKALHLNFKFDEAIAYYEKYRSFLLPKQIGIIKDVDHQIEMSNNAKIFVAAPINVKIKNLGKDINSLYDDYNPAFSADEKTLIFTSNRPGIGGGKQAQNSSFGDIYISYKNKDSVWSAPFSISKNINTSGNESSIGLSADAQTLLIYKDSNGGDIYSSTLDGNDWTVPKQMGSDINSAGSETSACITPDGNTLYFVSDRTGGFGGKDIWKCVKLPNGQWGKAQNLGSKINTPYDEETPFIHPSGSVLFFSSKGHQCIGGFDVFFSMKGLDNNWEEPLNIGYPINTPDDDMFYVTSPDGKRGYYSSILSEGFGGKDIYEISMQHKKELPLVLIKGNIIPNEGGKIPINVEIVVTNNETDIVTGIYKPLLRDGSFTIIIPPGNKYTLSYQKDGMEFFTELMEVPADAAYQEIEKEIHLKPIDVFEIPPVKK